MEIPEWVKERWFASKSGVVDVGELRYVRAYGSWVFYGCPGCGGVASRVYVVEGFSQRLSEVLTCCWCDRQWLVRVADVVGIIRGEEEKYLKLLEGAERVVERVFEMMGDNEESRRYLKETHGIDGELLPMRSSQPTR